MPDKARALLLAQRKAHIAKMHLFFKWAPFIFPMCFLPFTARSKKTHGPGALFRFFGKWPELVFTVCAISEPLPRV